MDLAGRWADERELVGALRAGDEAAFSELVSRHHPALVRIAQAYTGTRALAEEVAQDTWLAVLKGIDRFEGRSALRTWIIGILMNQAKTRATREKRTVPFSSLFDPGPGEPAVDPGRFEPPDDPEYPRWWSSYPARWDLPEDRSVANETRAVVQRAIDALPSGQRVVITLRDVEGATSDEACSALGISETNQRVLLHRARSKVRRALEEYLEGERV